VNFPWTDQQSISKLCIDDGSIIAATQGVERYTMVYVIREEANRPIAKNELNASSVWRAISIV
jgi:hypothetical protein